MGFLDLFRPNARPPAPAVAPKPREAGPAYQLTVQIGEQVSQISVPIEFDHGFILGADDPGAPRQKAGECWVPADRGIEIAGRPIDGGLIYVGSNLPGADNSYVVEPALVDPSLEVGSGAPGESSYWPSYRSLNPAQRGAYLDWLAGPRRRRGTEQTYLFLYYYGLERRLLADPRTEAAAREERGTLIAELKRLQAEGEEEDGHGSFARYLEALLDFLAAEDLLAGTREVEPPEESVGWEVPLCLRMMIGELAAARLALPAELARSWIMTSPEAYLRTPAERCPREFARLFSLRYRERFDEGLALPEGAPLRLSYRSASQGLAEAGRRTSVPDVCSSAQLVEPLRALGRDCCEELAAYSRWLGRHPEGAGFKGTALLPAALLAEADDPEVVGLRALLARACEGPEPWVLQADELIEFWDAGAEKLGKKDAVMLCQLLEKLGYGVEPDPRFAGPNLRRGMAAVLFAHAEGDPRAPSPAFAAARLMLGLLAAVAMADGTLSPEEEAFLESQIGGVEELYPGERARLRADGSWLTRSPSRLAGLRKDLAAQGEPEREALAAGVVALAAADGEIAPQEVRTLQKIFDLLGLDPEEVYGRLHAASSGEGPVVSGEGRPATDGEPVPGRGAAGEARQGLDRAAIDAKLEETAAVSTLLAGIFSEAEETEPARPEIAEEEPVPATGALSGAEHGFALALAERGSWSRAEVEELAALNEVMVDGALETVNEAAFELCGAPFSEGDEPIEIDTEVAKEMLA